MIYPYTTGKDSMESYGKRKHAFVKAALDADRAIKERTMSPLGIEILLHYYCTNGSDYQNGDFSAPAVRELLEKFVGLGLIDLVGIYGNPAVNAPNYKANREALQVYVEALCAVPLPVREWGMPGPEYKLCPTILPTEDISLEQTIVGLTAAIAKLVR